MGSIFVTDGSHWFLVPEDMIDEYYEFEEAMENDEEWNGTNFNEMMCGHPSNYVILDHKAREW